MARRTHRMLDRTLRTLLLAVAVAALAFAGSAWAQQGQGKGSQGGSGQGVHGGGSATQGGGQGGGTMKGKSGVPSPSAGEAEDSDRPAWSGGNREANPHSQGGGQPSGAGSKKGDIYGDLYVILRDANGVPILNADGYVQPLDANGGLIPLDTEGEPLDESLLVPVEFGRLSVGRSPTKVMDKSLSEALSKLTSATSITLDAAGRLVVDGTAIDSPLENLALYETYMKTGSLPGVTLPANFDPASLLAAAADKAGKITVDLVIYENTILGINQTNPDGTISYYDFSTFDYDRATTYATTTVTYLKDNGDGTYSTVTEPVMTAVFADQNWVDPTATGGADDFAQAADDARAVIEFVHDMPTP